MDMDEWSIFLEDNLFIGMDFLFSTENLTGPYSINHSTMFTQTQIMLNTSKANGIWIGRLNRVSIRRINSEPSRLCSR